MRSPFCEWNGTRPSIRHQEILQPQPRNFGRIDRHKTLRRQFYKQTNKIGTSRLSYWSFKKSRLWDSFDEKIEAARSLPPSVRSPQSAVRSPQAAVRRPQSAVRSPQAAVRRPQSVDRAVKQNHSKSHRDHWGLSYILPDYILKIPVTNYCLAVARPRLCVVLIKAKINESIGI